MKTVSLPDFLTPAEIEKAASMYNQKSYLEGTYARKVRDEIILPNLQRINKSLGQENDALYLAYVVEYVMMKTRGK